MRQGWQILPHYWRGLCRRVRPLKFCSRYWKHLLMQNAVRRSIPLLALLIPLACGSGLAHAQSGSAGGSIGNDEKSLSGSRAGESSKPARRSQPEADEPRRASRKSGGGGGNNFDGAWIVSAVGVTCQGTSSNAVVVTSGKIIGQTARGTVSPDGGCTAPPPAMASRSSPPAACPAAAAAGRSGNPTAAPEDGRRRNNSAGAHRTGKYWNKSLWNTRFNVRSELPSALS